jgi:phage tail-like protein
MAFSFLSDPIPNYKYGLEVGGVLVAGFMQFRGLEVSRETLEVVEGGINDHVHVLPGGLGHGQVTFERGITFTSFLWEWFHWGMNDTAVLHLPVIVIQYDTSGIPVRVWPMLNAFPVKWVGQSLDAASQTAAIETLELAFGGRRSEGGVAQRLVTETEATARPLGSTYPDGSGALPGSRMQRELAQKVFKLMKDSMRIERERAGKIGG